MLHQMLTENPMMMSAAMQQMMGAGATPTTTPTSPLAGLPSSADLMQQAHALQLLAQLQSVLMMNNPMLSRLQESQVSHDPPHDMKCAIVSSGQSSIDITMYSVPAAYLAENFWHSKAPLIEEFKLQSNTAMQWCTVYICSLLSQLYWCMQTCANMFLCGFKGHAKPAIYRL